MIMKHREHGFEIKITSRRGKPVVTRKGFVNIEKGVYKRCNTMQLEVLEDKFEVIA